MKSCSSSQFHVNLTKNIAMFNLLWTDWRAWHTKSSSYYFFPQFFVREIFELVVMWQEGNYYWPVPRLL